MTIAETQRMKTLEALVESLRKELAEFQRHVAQTYAKKTGPKNG